MTETWIVRAHVHYDDGPGSSLREMITLDQQVDLGKDKDPEILKDSVKASIHERWSREHEGKRIRKIKIAFIIRQTEKGVVNAFSKPTCPHKNSLKYDQVKLL